MASMSLDAIHSLDDRASGAHAHGVGGGVYGQAPLTLADFYDYYLIQKIRLYAPWLIVGFGLTGNLLILAIFMKKSRRCTSNGICFSALAIADSLALIFMLMRALLKLHIVSNVAVTCKLIKFIYHVSLQLSAWCLVLLTVDRLIAVLFVFKYTSWCKRFYALRGLLLIFLLVVVVNIHLVIFRDARPQANVERYVYNYNFQSYIRHRPAHMNSPISINEKLKYSCYVDPVKYSFYFVHIYNNWDIYHFVIYGAAPFLIILASNVAIIYKLTTANRNKSIAKTPMTTADETEQATGRQRYRRTRDPSIRSIQITVMLLGIAFLFLFLTSPISVYMAVFYRQLPHLSSSRRELIKVVLRYIGYVNNAANFYIYMIFSSEFRREFVGLFGRLGRSVCFRWCGRLFSKSASSCCGRSTSTSGTDSRASAPTSSTRLPSDSVNESRRILSLSKTTENDETLTPRHLLSAKQTPRSSALQQRPSNDVSNIYTDHRVLAKGMATRQQRKRQQQQQQQLQAAAEYAEQLDESRTPFINRN